MYNAPRDFLCVYAFFQAWRHVAPSMLDPAYDHDSSFCVNLAMLFFLEGNADYTFHIRMGFG
jgi:hypothetical protein